MSAPTTQRKPGLVSKVLPWILGGGFIALLALGFRPRPAIVSSAVVTTGPLTVTVLEEGKTRIRHRYVITSPVAGRLDRVPLRAGEKIEAGKTLLATLQPAPSSLLDPRTRAEAEARVQSAAAARDRATAQLDWARAALDLSKRDRDRAASLLKNKAISVREADTAENLALLNDRSLVSAEFAVKVAEFDLAQARAALLSGDAPSADGVKPVTLTAPVTGTVLNVFEENERTVIAGTQIMEIGDPKDLECEIEMLSSDAVTVAPGAEVSIEQWGGPTPLRGRVSVVEPGGYLKVSSLGVEEQRVKVRVDFLDPLPTDHPLGDRYRVEARIVTWKSDAVLQVPTGALFRRGSEWMTFALVNSVAHLTPVRIGHNNGIAAEVLAGLPVGQVVVLHPPDTIDEGSAVAVKVEK